MDRAEALRRYFELIEELAQAMKDVIFLALYWWGLDGKPVMTAGVDTAAEALRRYIELIEELAQTMEVD